MGYSKWILRNGFGSPGSTTKSYIKQYNLIPKSNHENQWMDLYSLIYDQRIGIFIRLGNLGGHLFSSVNKEKIIGFSEGDLALFVFEMMFLSTSQFRNAILANRDNFLLTTEVMREVVMDLAPTTLKLRLNEFREKAMEFIYIYK